MLPLLSEFSHWFIVALRLRVMTISGARASLMEAGKPLLSWTPKYSERDPVPAGELRQGLLPGEVTSEQGPDNE